MTPSDRTLPTKKLQGDRPWGGTCLTVQDPPKERTDVDKSESQSGTSPALRALPAEVQQALAAGLGNFSLRELLGLVLTTLGQAERQAYLARSSTDKGNGSYPRSLKLGSIPLQIEVPRTRTGGFRPTLLPPP